VTINKLLLCLCLACPLGAHGNCPQADPEQIAALAQASSKALNALFERERSMSAGAPSRNLAIVSVALTGEGRLDARVVEALIRHLAAHPDDQLAKLYQGYAWVFSAGEFYRQKNYLRAAEEVKRGFFLIDEAVDSAPENWRLRYLRLRLDAFVPDRLGRYVIALKDAALLSEDNALAPGMRPLVEALRAAALERSGDTQAAEQAFAAARAQFPGSAITPFSSTCALQQMLTLEEINTVLVPVLESSP